MTDPKVEVRKEKASNGKVRCRKRGSSIGNTNGTQIKEKG